MPTAQNNFTLMFNTLNTKTNNFSMATTNSIPFSNMKEALSISTQTNISYTSNGK